MSKLKVVDRPPSERVPGEDDLEVNQWYWVRYKDEDDDEDDPEVWLGCVTHIGSNYAKIKAPNGRYSRIHLNEFWSVVHRREHDPDRVIQGKIAEHQKNVNGLLGEIKKLTARLGLQPVAEITNGEQATGLVVANKQDVKAHKKALIKAKEETLPDLFKKVEAENKEMATWMKAQLLPFEAEKEKLKNQTECIEDRIFTVELYAGLVEEVKHIRKGEPAPSDTKIHLFQRRHYMDEESLLDYKAGGMDFKGISSFDRWLMKKGNRERILPMPRCIVAFKVRRKKKHREAKSLSDFIKFREFDQADKWTFLYMRNGDNYYRLRTGIEFGDELFPDTERSKLVGGQLYMRQHFGTEILSEQEHQSYLADKKATAERYEARYQEELAEWKAMTPAQRKGKSKPYRWGHTEVRDEYEPVTPASVYYDDAMMTLAKETQEHNRIAVVLQGLLDRSPVFHPHPPWRIYTPEGFSSGIELVHDETRAITVGDAPDFEAYREALNASIKKGSRTVGQHRYWMRVEAEKENKRQDNDWRIRSPFYYDYFEPYGNPGPGTIAEVQSLSRDKTQAKFSWERERQRGVWEDHPDKPGYIRKAYPNVAVHLKVPVSKLLHVDAYTPGDYKQFYEDPRTRADYLRWAPLLLAAEDWHARDK